jgi:hypothetical protein
MVSLADADIMLPEQATTFLLAGSCWLADE